MTSWSEDVDEPTENVEKEEEQDDQLVNRLLGCLRDSGGDISVQQSDENSPLYSGKTFEELGISENVLRAIFEMGFLKPSRIQGLAIPNIIKGDPNFRNFIGQAQSGTGKTLAFSVSMIERCNAEEPVIQAICVTPTRELARQTYDVIKNLSKHTKVTCSLLVPKEKLPKKITSHIIVGTPGKIIESLDSRQMTLDKVKIFVMDEADNLLSAQSMSEQMSKIRLAITSNVQVCLFSATYAEYLAQFVDRLVPDPKVKVELKPEQLSLDKMIQVWIDCKNRDNKYNILKLIYRHLNVGQTIIFVQSISWAKKLQSKLLAEQINCSLLYGSGMDVTERDRIMDDFKTGASRVLISTNVLSRGIDVLQVSLVVNYDLPIRKENNRFEADPETYIHRVGRTARAGRTGLAVNFVHDQITKNYLNQIQNYTQKTIEQVNESDFEKLGTMLKEYDI